jgi:phage FluMu protein Com
MGNLIDELTAYDEEHGMSQSDIELFAKAFEAREATSNYLCAIGVEPEHFPSYFAFTAQLLKLRQKYSSVTLLNECQKRIGYWIDQGLDLSILCSVAQLQGMTFETDSTPASAPDSTPVAQPAAVPPPNRKRELWRDAVLTDARDRMRNKLLRVRRDNVCCNELARVETNAYFEAKLLVSARAWFFCPRCKRSFGNVSEDFEI